MYLVELSKQAKKDKKLLKAAGLDKKAKILLNIIMINPFQNPPPYEKLSMDLKGSFSRRLNAQHRLVYDVVENTENFLSPDGTPYEGIVRI
ncbi:MAG: Txe/YoeB family addiction module toxin, partial [Synergistaceae bacterium]|nr:Txe/YoeB family addiction module toxin [Synergistaceae bacterium]